jgi:hypothetical protein
MRALSLRPPWPYAIFHLGKDIENRPWRINWRGKLLIHASKTWDQQGYDFLSDSMDEYVPSKEQHVFGAIVGTVELIDCVSEHHSKWFFGDYGFVLEDPKQFTTPLPWPGKLGIFDVPTKIIKETF